MRQPFVKLIIREVAIETLSISTKRQKDSIFSIEDVKPDFIDASYADIIDFAGQVSLEDASIPAMALCAGSAPMPLMRQAATMPSPSFTRLSAVVKVKDTMSIKRITARQRVALADDLDSNFFDNLIKASDAGNQGKI